MATKILPQARFSRAQEPLSIRNGRDGRSRDSTILLEETCSSAKQSGGSTFPWGCFSAAQTRRLVRDDGNLNGAKVVG